MVRAILWYPMNILMMSWKGFSIEMKFDFFSFLFSSRFLLITYSLTMIVWSLVLFIYFFKFYSLIGDPEENVNKCMRKWICFEWLSWKIFLLMARALSRHSCLKFYSWSCYSTEIIVDFGFDFYEFMYLKLKKFHWSSSFLTNFILVNFLILKIEARPLLIW